jgi:hypothetical protein
LETKLKWKYNIAKLVRCYKNNSTKEVYNDKCLHGQKRIKLSNKQPNQMSQVKAKEDKLNSKLEGKK